MSHLKSPDHSLTLLTLITAVILFAVASVLRTEGPVPSCDASFFCFARCGRSKGHATLFFVLNLSRIVLFSGTYVEIVQHVVL